MTTALHVLLGVLAVLSAGLLLRRLVEWVGAPCQFCEQKTRPFRRLDAQTSVAILAYFHDYEGREPDTSGLFVCLNCHTVHDDFSGERASWDVDAYGCVTFCKVCLARIRGCEPGRQVECPDCGTTYAWTTHEASGFRLFMPTERVQVSARGPGMQLDSR